MKISVIIPCFNEASSLPVLYTRLSESFRQISAEREIIFVDDGSTDETLSIIKDFAKTDKTVNYISLSRNFGKESAIYAGLCGAAGDYVAVMDADLQDPPELLPKMAEILDGGEYDIVAARRISRKGEPFFRSLFAKIFYKILNSISDTEISDGARDYRMMTRKPLEAVKSVSEKNRFSKGVFSWIGFKTFWLSFENNERIGGKTKWSFKKLLKYGIEGIVNFSDAPLNLASFTGFFATFFSFFALLFIIIRKLIFDDPVAGWASTVCIIIFLGGLQLLSLGIIGKYLAKTYSETKNRPIYIVKDTNFESVDPMG
ncbi:MAG TPA: glycosyltransferase [Ruminococcaceae bacterium]|nr:glycosyltransferase [Oscillospiraceae bacterium]